MFPEGRIFEFLIVGAIALIVVGPKDLPLLMRKVGRFVGHMRGMAAEFRASFDEMARQSELDELRKEVEAMRAGQPLQTAVGLGQDQDTRQVFDDIHASLRSGDAQLHPPMSYQTPPGMEASPEATETKNAPTTTAGAAPRARRRTRSAKPGAVDQVAEVDSADTPPASVPS